MLLLSSCVASHLSTGIEPSFIWQSSLISNNVSSLRLPWLKSLATSNPRSWCSRAGFLLKNRNMKVPRHKGTTHDYTSYTQQQRTKYNGILGVNQHSAHLQVWMCNSITRTIQVYVCICVQRLLWECFHLCLFGELWWTDDLKRLKRAISGRQFLNLDIWSQLPRLI